jgi:hypothetical protein
MFRSSFCEMRWQISRVRLNNARETNTRHELALHVL